MNGINIVVDNDYTNATCNSVDRECGNIASALNIAADNDIIGINPGIYSGSMNMNLCQSGCTATNLTLQANPQANSANLVVLDYSLVDSSSDRAIYMNSNQIVYVNDITIRNFKVSSADGRGAVYIELSTFSLNNVVFESNLGVSGGAVSVLRSNGTLTGCTFNNNRATSGGALFATLSNVSMVDSYFYNNSASSSGITTSVGIGGAVYFGGYASDHLLIKDSVFELNYASASGGAVYVESLSTSSSAVAVEGSTSAFTSIGTVYASNSAVSAGGAVYILSQSFDFQSCTFTKNIGNPYGGPFPNPPGQGGAMWFSAGLLTGTIANSSFLNNAVYGGGGGAIYGTENSGLVLVKDCDFTANSAVSTYTFPAQGGAILVASGVTLNVQNCKLMNNTALPQLELIPLTYSGSGGAIYVQSCNFSLISSQLVRNFALTGQFDAGATGGAVTLIDSYPVLVCSR